MMAPLPPALPAARIYGSAGRWTLIAGLLAIAAVYQLGLEVGDRAARRDDSPEDLEVKVDGVLKDVTKDYSAGAGAGANANLRVGEKVPPQQTNAPTKTPTRTPTKAPTNHPTNPPIPTSDPTSVAVALPPTKAPTQSSTPSGWEAPPNPFLALVNGTDRVDFWKAQWAERATNADDINAKYGIYCPDEPAVPMCPALDAEGNLPDAATLAQGPTLPCAEAHPTGERCGDKGPHLNKTIWPKVRGPLCAAQDKKKRSRFPTPPALLPYLDLGYDRADPTKSKDASPLTQDDAVDHFLRFEAALDDYYEGLSRPLLERQLKPIPNDPEYEPMLQAHADQIKRALLRGQGAAIVLGVLGDSVTAGQDNCYYDAWPEQLRRQMAPLFHAMGLRFEVRNAAKNGGWNLASQMLCAHDMLGVDDATAGLDFLFVANPFVKAEGIDVENLVRRALRAERPTLVSLTMPRGISEQDMQARYAAAGFTIGKPAGDSLPELGLSGKGLRYWFPNKGRAFWGMNGDGFCHLTTRSGSASIVNRNWHWGPLTHQTYADAYALLFSRAAVLALTDIAAGRTPPRPAVPPGDPVLAATPPNDPPTWQNALRSDLDSDDAMGGGIAGVRCAVGSANQPASTLLSDWLRPAADAPFAAAMTARGGTGYVPADAAAFYVEQAPISKPNGAHEVGEWVPDPEGFGAEAPRTAAQCKHVDGSTMINKQSPKGTSWLTWLVPAGTPLRIGRILVCTPRNKKGPADDAFDTDAIRVHTAVMRGEGWTVAEDVHRAHPVAVGKECTPVVQQLSEADRSAARASGLWVALEWTKDAVFDFDYLVAM